VTATDFDPEAIAARVLEREQSAPPAPAGPLPPLARAEGDCITGSGQTRGRPLPMVAEGDGSDIFDRVERQRQAKRVQSPIVLRDVPFEPTARTSAERAAVEEQYVAPPLVEDDDPADVSVPHGPNCQDFGCTLHADPATEPAAELEVAPDPATPEPTHDPRCGEILSGGGGPRGWVLIRVIGSGAPRRYCSPECAIQALTERPDALQELVEVVAAPTPPARRRRSAGTVAQHLDEIVRRYQAGETAVVIGGDLGHTAKTIRDALDRAGIQRRDDRTTRSGGANRIEDYPEQLVADVRRLYVDDCLTQRAVGDRLGVSAHVVQRLMERHGIEARPPAHKENDPNELERRRKLSAAGKARTDLGYPVAKIRAWAQTNGIRCPERGRFLPREVVDAYEAAHNGADVVSS
jgi:hypothetical protein